MTTLTSDTDRKGVPKSTLWVDHLLESSCTQSWFIPTKGSDRKQPGAEMQGAKSRRVPVELPVSPR